MLHVLGGGGGINQNFTGIFSLPDNLDWLKEFGYTSDYVGSTTTNISCFFRVKVVRYLVLNRLHQEVSAFK